MSRRWVALMVVALAVAVSPSTRAANCEEDILPTPNTAGEQTCEYRHVPASTFLYENGNLRVAWSDNYRITDLFIVKDWTKAAAYVPGASVPFVHESGVSSYMLIGRFVDLTTSEEFLGLTPISCRHRRPLGGEELVIPADLEGCWGEDPLGCSTQADVTCPDGSKRTVDCSGDTSTCSTSCSTGTTACCTSSVTTTVVTAGGTTIVTVVQLKESSSC